MTERIINHEVFDFVSKLIVETEDNQKKTPTKLKGSLGNLRVTKLKNVIKGPIIFTSYISEISDFKISISIDGKSYGFENAVYLDFYKFINEISKFNCLHKKVSIDYLKKQTLLWIIDVYKKNKANQSLINYLLNELEKEIKLVKYYYPILNLEIEKPFKIGDIEFTYFTKKYFDELWEIKKVSEDIKKKVFDSVYRKHQGRVFAAIEVSAEGDKGNEISYRLACLASDIIKLLSPTVYHPNEECLIDLEKRMPFKSEYLSMEVDKDLGFNVSISVNRGQFFISNEHYSNIEGNLIKLFGKVLKNETHSPIVNLVIESIKFMANSISETDLHLRISHLIMVVESIFLLDNEDYRMEKKCKRRMCDLLYSNNVKKKQNLFDVLTEMYRIRHKMTHKSIREYIELQLLREFQINMIEVILKLLNNSNRIKNKENLIIYLDRNLKTNT